MTRVLPARPAHDEITWFCSTACRDEYAANPGRFTTTGSGVVNPA